METTVLILVWLAALFIGFETFNWIYIASTNGSYLSVAFRTRDNGSLVDNAWKAIAPHMNVIGRSILAVILADVLFPALILGGILRTEAFELWAIMNILYYIFWFGFYKIGINLLKKDDAEYSYEVHMRISELKRSEEALERAIEARLMREREAK